ncbi:MAG: hypothetical protein EOP04_17700, partial [Proteobacteria bacterium]
MKNVLAFLFVLIFFQTATCQSLLFASDVSFETELKDMFSATDAARSQLWVFAGTSERTSAFLYSREVMQTDSLSFSRPPAEYEYIAGCGFDDNGNPSLYWSSSDAKKIFSQTLAFRQRSLSSKSYVFQYENENLLISFQHRNKFYILTVAKDENELILYEFIKGVPQMRVLDLSAFTFETARGQKLKLSSLLEYYPPQLIEENGLTPLSVAAQECKIYPNEDNLLITFDQSPGYTRIFTINLSDFSVTEQKIQQQQLTEASLSNSFINGDMLFQFKANRSEMLLSASKLKTKQVINTFRVGEDDNVSFKNGPLLLQSPNGNLTEFSSTKKFLRRIGQKPPAVSVYKRRDGYLLVTAGAVQNYIPAGDVLLGIGAIAAGVSDSGFFDEPREQQISFFESIF